MPVGDISPIGMVKVKKSIADEMWAWVSVRHANFMSSSHDQMGPNKLNFYTNARTPVLNVDKDLDSGAKDDGSEWIVWTEYYDKINGLNDHWAKGQASGMLGDFMGMVTGEDAEAKFIQPLKVLHEVNHLIPTKDKPRASLSDLSNAAQLLVVFTVPKELVAEAQKMIDDHAVWMQELHGNHKMLGRDISFMPEHELLYYSAGSCPVLVNHMDLSSGSDPDGSFIFVITEFYKTKAGLENQWKHGKEMAEAKGEDFTLGQMDALEKKGMQTTFIQPLAVKASINWFGKPGTD